MSDPTSLTDITQAQFDAAERIVIDLVRSAYPQLDMRKGTVLRDVLIQPDAALSALNQERVNRLRQIMSLVTMQEEGVNPTEAQINAILGNFNMQLNTGSVTTGSLRIKVDANRVYTIAVGTQFTTVAGLIFETSQLYVVKVQANPAFGELTLYSAADGTYYFILPVVAAASGSQYNIVQGTALNPVSQMLGFISASAYTNFSTGRDAETLNDAVSRIPAAISHRGLTNRTAIEAQLRSRFDNTGINIQALSVQGYGDPAQLRDKHNVFGTAVGGRGDIYVRTFVEPSITVLEKTGTRTVTGTYTFTIDVADAPGFYAIRSITDFNGTALSSYQYAEVRAADATVDDSWHDIDLANGAIESAYSVFQNSTVTVTGVLSTEATHVFKVELYSMPGLVDIQDYVDDQAVRNVTADFMVRCPLICLVTCTAKVYYSLQRPIDIAALQSNLAAYINSRSFVSRLTRSELATILLTGGATRVELGTTGMALEGRVRDANGTWHTLMGDSLDLTAIEDGSTLLVPETCVFAAELQNIHLTGIAE